MGKHFNAALGALRLVPGQKSLFPCFPSWIGGKSPIFST
jgi:hypothetical protein